MYHMQPITNMQPTKEEYYALAEPDAHQDMDRWLAWIGQIEANLATLSDFLRDAEHH